MHTYVISMCICTYFKVSQSNADSSMHELFHFSLLPFPFFYSIKTAKLILQPTDVS